MLISQANLKSLTFSAQQESYRRRILNFERWIEACKENLKDAQDFIAQLQAEKEIATDKQRLLQIEVDIAYLQEVIQEVQPEVLIENYERQLLSHKKAYLDRKAEKIR